MGTVSFSLVIWWEREREREREDGERKKKDKGIKKGKENKA